MNNKAKFFWQFIAALFGAGAGLGIAMTVLLYLSNEIVGYEPGWYESTVNAILFGSPILGAVIAIILIRQVIKKIR